MEDKAPTPWFYTVETAKKKAVFVLNDNTGQPIGATHSEDIAKRIVTSVNALQYTSMGGTSDVIHTACKHCQLDIEGIAPYPKGEWRDRGNNRYCPDPEDKQEQPHEPLL